MSEFMSLEAAVSRMVKPGDTVALEGFTHLIPVCRRSRDHPAAADGPDVDPYDAGPDLRPDDRQLDAPRKLVFSWGGNPGVGSLHRLRDAVEKQWPLPLEIEEHSHSAMAHAYAAGASGMPAAFFRGYRGSDLTKVNPNIRFITCPVHR